MMNEAYPQANYCWGRLVLEIHKTQVLADFTMVGLYRSYLELEKLRPWMNFGIFELF
jgi:hypothetical protein